MLVHSQEDTRFKEFELRHKLDSSFEDQILMASNLEILSPFNEIEGIKDHEYKV